MLILFLRSQRTLWFKIPVLTLTILFIFKLSNLGSFSFVFLLPSLLLVQEVQSTIYTDYQNGFIEQWVGNGKSMVSYMGLRSLSFLICLILPFLCAVSVFIDSSLNEGLFLLSSLFFVSLNCVFLGCLLGNSFISNPYLGIFILPLQIPSLIWIIQALSSKDYGPALILCAGVCAMSMGLNFLLCDVLQKEGL